MADTPDTGAAPPPPTNPAEAQFPYLVAHGLRPAETTPSLLRTGAAGRQPRNWLPLVLVGGLAALALVAASLTWGSRPFLGPRSDAAARHAVRDYLEALARGDAGTVLRYALRPPTDPSLLTNDLLATQRTRAPISEIDVQPAIGPGRVPASYLLGGEQISAVFELAFADGGWRLDRVAAPVDLGGLEVAVALNGIAPATSTPSLFPGQYEITSLEPRFEVVDAAFTVRHPFEQPSVGASLQLSAMGQAEVITAAQQHLDACLERADLDPPDCGFALADPPQTPLDESTVDWSTRGPSDLTGVAVELDGAGSATAELDLTVYGDIRGIDGSHWLARVHLTKLRADLTGPRVEVQFG